VDGGAPGCSTPHSRANSAPSALRQSFDAALSSLKDVHRYRLCLPQLQLRHPEACGRPPRLTGCVALGCDSAGRKCVNQYVRVRTLARGSYGKVVLHTSRKDGRPYALKVLSKSALARRHVSRGVSALADVYQEAALLGLLAHPRIVRLLEVMDDPEEDRLYLVLEALEGPVFQEGAAALSQRRAAQALRDVAQALQHCHWQGVCHGDVKPDNLLAARDGSVRLIDFSVSQLLSPAAQTRTEALGPGDAQHAEGNSARTPGTPAYTAPECCTQGAFSGEAADVWALGCSLFTMLTGAPPFVGDTLLETYERIRSDTLAIPPHLQTSAVAGLLRRMLDKEPASRATLEEVLAHPWLAEQLLDSDALGVGADR